MGQHPFDPEDDLRLNKNATAAGAQTERRGEAGPVRS
jgi:hypothetical protein